MESVEFRLHNGVVEYRALIVRSSTVRNCDGDEYDGPLEEHGYTDWMPFPTPRIATCDSLKSSYDLSARRAGK